MYLSSQKPMEVLKSGLIFQIINFEGLRSKLGRIAPGEKETDIETRTPPPPALRVKNTSGLPSSLYWDSKDIIKYTHIRAFLFDGVYTNILHFVIWYNNSNYSINHKIVLKTLKIILKFCYTCRLQNICTIRTSTKGQVFFAPNNVNLSPPHSFMLNLLIALVEHWIWCPPCSRRARYNPLTGATQGKSKRPKNFPL